MRLAVIDYSPLKIDKCIIFLKKVGDMNIAER